MLSIVILTLNEERALPRCLASVAGCDDLVVLDSGSTDRTVELAGFQAHEDFDEAEIAQAERALRKDQVPDAIHATLQRVAGSGEVTGNPARCQSDVEAWYATFSSAHDGILTSSGNGGC